MRRDLLAFAILALLVLAGAASAAPADKHIELEADDGQGCLEEMKNDCYRVVNGTSLDGIEQGMIVHVVLENVGSTSHNVFVTEAANADENNLDTGGGDAINSSATVDAGETADLMFRVPGDAGGLYFWCDVQSHEALGMWLQTEVSEAQPPDGGDDDSADEQDEGDGAADGGDGEGEDPGRFLPAPGPVAAIAATLGAAVATRGGRSR